MVNVEQRRSWPEFYSNHRFAILLVLLVQLLVGTSLATDIGLPVWWLDGSISLFLLLAIFSLCFEPYQRLFALSLGIPSILIVIGGNAISGPWTQGLMLLGRACQMLFLFGSSFLIVKSLFQPHKFTFDSVFGAICGYIFLGMGWTFIFLLIEVFQPGSIVVNQAVIPANEPNRPMAVVLSYFSFATLTSVGYGDVLPSTPITRTLAWMEAMTGQFYLAVVVAGLVNMGQQSQGTTDDADKQSA
ncbi:hypothetical protein GC163_22985 [bacterium]|nr:hypothetical protein [bacterium]